MNEICLVRVPSRGARVEHLSVVDEYLFCFKPGQAVQSPLRPLDVGEQRAAKGGATTTCDEEIPRRISGRHVSRNASPQVFRQRCERRLRLSRLLSGVIYPQALEISEVRGHDWL